MMGLGEYGRLMNERAKKITLQTNKQVIQLAGDILRNLVLATPVATGHARANWQVSIDAPIETELNASLRVQGRDASGLFTAAVGGERSVQETIQAGQNTLQGRQLGQTIYITNNVPYIQYLNEGSSSQAPAGFVENAVNQSLVSFRSRKVTE